MTNSIDLDTLSNIILQQIDLLSKLDATLTEEYTQLQNKQADQLETIATVKLSLLSELKQLELQQTALLASTKQQGITLKGLLNQLGHLAPATLASHIDKLDVLANKCNDQNKVNGIMIHSRRRVNYHILSLLQQQTTQTAIYGKRGETTSQSINVTSVKA